ncbi:hypothetical protein Y695_02755 [Hydrogenophaga sp. T4]|nr:hypothetical protein Y695_02755 [Hydrogenophaga sp. T4]
MQHHAFDAAREWVVVAVGVPADGLVGVGDEVGTHARPLRRHRDRRNAVFVGQPVGVEPVQAQLRPEQARQRLVFFDNRAAVDHHVGERAGLQQRRTLVVAQAARIDHVDDQVFHAHGLSGQFGRPPLRVGLRLVEVKRADFRQQIHVIDSQYIGAAKPQPRTPWNRLCRATGVVPQRGKAAKPTQGGTISSLRSWRRGVWAAARWTGRRACRGAPSPAPPAPRRPSAGL